MRNKFKTIFVHAFYPALGLLCYSFYGFEKAVIIILSLIVANVVLLNDN
jgi:hypothetical protein